MDRPHATDSARPRLAILSYSSGEFDARSFRVARSAIDAGWSVTMYTRWHAGQPPVEERDGYRLIRVPYDARFAVPLMRGRLRGAYRVAMDAAAGAHAAAPAGGDDALRPHAGGPEPGNADAGPGPTPPEDAQRALAARLAIAPFRLARRAVRKVVRRLGSMVRISLIFPLRPIGWSVALDDVVEPADLWHGMWAGSLPALVRMQRRHGGRTIYDSRDVYMLSRDFASLGWPLRPLLSWAERRWARRVDRVLTVNEPYADLLVDQLGVPRPPVVVNCPERWEVPSPAPDLIREAIGLPADTSIALYQGQLVSERGIEQAMEAVLQVPDTALVLLGFGRLGARYRRLAEAPPYLGKVFVLPPVTPGELLAWTASADVMVMAIQPTTMNHRYTTPQKLWEAVATGVPVVASDLPGMATVIRDAGIGVLVDPTRPASIAAGMRRVLQRSASDRAMLRRHVLSVAHDRYTWEAQLETLFGVYRELVPAAPDPAAAREAAVAAAVARRPRPVAGPDVSTPGWGPPGATPEAGPRLEFRTSIAAARPAPTADTTVILLDTAWTAADGQLPEGTVLLRDVAAEVMRRQDLFADASAALDDWAEASGVVDLMASDGTSHWYGARQGHWTWLMDRMLWLAIIDRLLADHPGTAVLAIEADAGPDLRHAADEIARERGLAVDTLAGDPFRLLEGPREQIDGGGSAAAGSPRRAWHAPRRPADASLVKRLKWRFRPPAQERLRRLVMGRVAMLKGEPPRLLVVQAHVRQRVETGAGPRLINVYLGPIMERLRGTRLEPYEVEINASLEDAATAERLAAPDGGRSLPREVTEMLAERLAIQPFRDRAAATAAAIGALRVPLIVSGVDLGPALAARVSSRAGATLARRLADSERIYRLLVALRPAGILIADEYHRQDWLAAASAAGVTVVAVQHGLIHPHHPGYIHRSRPEALRLPDRTYVYGRWERSLLVERSAYRPEEVVVGGSPRLDYVAAPGPATPEERAQTRAEHGVAPGDRLLVVSGTWAPLYRRFHYPIVLAALFAKPLRDVHVVVKLHPSERDEGPYRRVIEGMAIAGGFEPPRVTVVQDVDLYRLLAAADAHLGIHSTVLTEAVFTDTPNLIASGLAGADFLGYVDAGVATPLASADDLAAALDRPRDEAMTREARDAFLAAHFEPGSGSERIATDLLRLLS